VVVVLVAAGVLVVVVIVSVAAVPVAVVPVAVTLVVVAGVLVEVVIPVVVLLAVAANRSTFPLNCSCQEMRDKYFPLPVHISGVPSRERKSKIYLYGF